MKRQFPLLAALLVSTSATFAGSFGPGPWASGSYFPGGTDGKYQASVTGNNITGVIGFSIREGGPSTITPDQQNQQNTETTSAAASTVQAATATTQVFDETQNYFVIFVEGRTYTGLAVASVNPVANTVVGSLLGAQPDFSFVTNSVPFQFPTNLVTNVVVERLDGVTNFVVTTNPSGIIQTNITNTITITNSAGVVTSSNQVITTNVVSLTPELITNAVPVFVTNIVVTNAFNSFFVDGVDGTTNVFDPLPILNRGLSGGFQAQLNNKGSTMSFVGTGQLSSPAQTQTVDLTTNSKGEQISGGINTETVPFFVNGIRTSFSTALTVTETTTQ